MNIGGIHNVMLGKFFGSPPIPLPSAHELPYEEVP